MIPIRDDNPTFHPSIVAYAIIGLNVASWILLQGFGMYPQLMVSVFKFGVIPGELLGLVPPGTSIPVGQGMQYVVEATPNFLSVVTHMFMHGGWLHIIGNMWFLWIFGDNVEDRLGHSRYLGFYLFAGFSASFLHILFNASSRIPVIGASGAIAGVMAAYLLLFPYARILTLIPLFVFIPLFIEIPAYLFILFWFMTQLLSGTVSLLSLTSGGIAWWAHVGGFLAGIFVVLRVRKREKKRYVNPSLYS